jgi:hypothetical protein
VRSKDIFFKVFNGTFLFEEDFVKKEKYKRVKREDEKGLRRVLGLKGKKEGRDTHNSY